MAAGRKPAAIRTSPEGRRIASVDRISGSLTLPTQIQEP